MPCFFCKFRFFRVYPIESFFKLLFLSIHLFVEIITGLHRSSIDNHLILEYENLHHVCMLSAYILGSIVEILMFFGVPLPNRSEYIFNLLAGFIQSFLMLIHLHGDQGVEYQVHFFWAILIACTFVCGCFEAYKPNDVWPTYFRIFFFLAQGTWLMQIAFVVWPHTTNPVFVWNMDHPSHTWLTVSLMFHLMGCAILLAIQYLFVYFLINLFDRCYERYELDLTSFNSYKTRYSFERFKDLKEYAVLINDQEENEA